MELSAELLRSTIAALRSDSVEGRKHPRAPIRSRVKILPVVSGALGAPVEVWTRDISSGGIGIISPAPLTAGSAFIVRLPDAQGGAMYLRCTVRNCISQAKQIFIIGSSFIEFAPAPSSGL